MAEWPEPNGGRRQFQPYASPLPLGEGGVREQRPRTANPPITTQPNQPPNEKAPLSQKGGWGDFPLAPHHETSPPTVIPAPAGIQDPG